MDEMQDGQTTQNKNVVPVHFVDRMYAQQAVKERRGADKSQRGREDARAAWLDAQRDPRGFDGAWSAWIKPGHNARASAAFIPT